MEPVTETAREDVAAEVLVDLGARADSIHIGRGLLGRTGRLVSPLLRRPKTVIVTDETVAALHLPSLVAALEAEGIASSSVVLPPGERTKSFAGLERLVSALLDADVERGDVIVAFGGGVIGDLAGFAAAIVRRGVDFVQIPTTLLAQVDSSVGGKTGINTDHGKNLVGAFHQPLAVIADTGLLDTLPEREFRAGYAEVVKYGLLGDAGFFAWLEEYRSSLFAGETFARIHAIATSCRAKARIVAADEREAGIRALLNLGHTFGHALEAVTGYSDRLVHGEAVAIGMAMAFRFSERLRLCAAGTAARVERHLAAAGLPVTPRTVAAALPTREEFLELMRQDKKTRGGRITLVLVRGIGEAFVAPDVDEAQILAFLGEEFGRP